MHTINGASDQLATEKHHAGLPPGHLPYQQSTIFKSPPATVEYYIANGSIAFVICLSDLTMITGDYSKVDHSPTIERH